jgi:hypothetical protein
MALVWPLVAGLLAAPLLGGSWRRLETLSLRAAPLFLVAFALQVVAFPVHALPWHTSDRAAVVLWLLSYGLLAAGAFANLRRPGVALVGLGMVANVAAIAANGGHMPALPGALRAAGLRFTLSRNSVALLHPRLAWLVDRWAAPRWVPFANVFSLGDVAISLGACVFALAACGVGRRSLGAASARPRHEPAGPVPAAETPPAAEREAGVARARTFAR